MNINKLNRISDGTCGLGPGREDKCQIIVVTRTSILQALAPVPVLVPVTEPGTGSGTASG